MGADLALTYCLYPHYTDGTAVPLLHRPDETKYVWELSPEGERVRQEVLDRAAALDPSYVRAIHEDAFGELEAEPDVAEVFGQSFDEAFDYRNRDTTTLQIGGKWYIFTGGMTWGDDPTHSFPYVGFLDTSCVLDAPFGDNPTPEPTD